LLFHVVVFIFSFVVFFCCCFLLSSSVYLSSQYHVTYTLICIFVRFTFCFFLLYSYSHVNTRPALHNAHTFFAYSTRYLVKYTLSPIHSNTYEISFSHFLFVSETPVDVIFGSAINEISTE